MTTDRRQAARWIALAAIGLLLAACGGPKIKIPDPPKPSTLELQTTAKADLNPDGNGRPSPLQVRVYALRSVDGFNSADFFTLYDKDEQTLAADIIKREELTLHPGETVKLPREYPPETQFIGVMGAFRDIEHSTWRATVPLQAGTKGFLSVTADSKSVAVELEKNVEKEKKK